MLGWHDWNVIFRVESNTALPIIRQEGMHYLIHTHTHTHTLFVYRLVLKRRKCFGGCLSFCPQVEGRRATARSSAVKRQNQRSVQTTILF
jgi:hypothetical protein